MKLTKRMLTLAGKGALTPFQLAGYVGSSYYSMRKAQRSYDFNNRQSKAYSQLDKGYQAYLKRHGLRVNSNRDITQGFKAKSLSSDVAAQNALDTGYASLYGAMGASAGSLSKLLK